MDQLKIKTSNKITKNFDKKYVCTPNKKIPTKNLNDPKYLAPLIPNDDLNKTTKGNPNFCDGFPIKFEKKYTSKDPNRVPKKTTKVLRL